MKARNKFEAAVMEQSKHLRPITKQQIKWAFRECISHFAYRLPKGCTTCMDCGHSWVMNKPRETCTCPHCRAKLQVQTTRARKHKEQHYFTILTTSGNYQVLRMCLLIVGMEKGYPAESSVMEIGQYWWNNQGKQTIVAIQQRNGFAGDCHDIAPTKLIPALLTDSRAETLFKGGRTADLRHFLINPQGIDQHWAAYKIALRNHYDIIDIALWCDYVDMLRRLGKDIHSPKYVCPENLQEAHDTAQRKLQAQRDKEAEAQRRQKAIENEERFQELKSPFFGITFTDGVIQVKVLESVQEYLEEGKALHHCVFTNEYYLKKQSLILSARINGKRIETIEVSLETMKVIQCRGLQNKNTEYHDRIIDLVNRNIRQIQSRVA